MAASQLGDEPEHSMRFLFLGRPGFSRAAGLLLVCATGLSTGWRSTALAESIPLEILEPAQRIGSVTGFPVAVGLVFDEIEREG